MPAEQTIAVSEENWRRLNSMKEGPGDTFDDVVSRLIEHKRNGGDGE